MKALLAATLAALFQLHAGAGEPVDSVNPLIGTAPGHGKVFPGATTPFGLVQLSPDTITGGDNGSGYRYDNDSIEGFSFTHMSGVGWYGDLGNLLVTPTTGPLRTERGQKPGDGYRSGFRHDTEVAQAGYYAVTLDDGHVRAELTAAPHAGLLRFTFPQQDQARLQLDLARRVGGTAVRQAFRVVDDHTLEGWMRCTAEGGGWGNGSGHPDYTVYFCGQFSRPLVKFGAWSAELPDDFKPKLKEIDAPKFRQLCAQAKVMPGCRELEGRHIGFYSEFAPRAGETVLFKAGISFVSIAGARRNLAAEIPGWDFEAVRAQARQAWAGALAKVQVEGGTEGQRRAYYTALYHTMIDPRAFADRDGAYPGGDGKTHQSDKFTKRTIFSGWDVFRSQYPLQTIINPAIVNDTINSLVELANESGKGYLERWEFLNSYSGCMVGNPAVVVLADAYGKGIRGYDAQRAYAAARATCEKFGNGERGFTPGSLSSTLEYAHNEWCLSRLAAALGKQDDAQLYAHRAQSYRNVFDPQVGWFHPRDAKGDWLPWTERGRLEGRGSTESNYGQQGWFVPHDVAGLAALLGGREQLVAQLGRLFEQTRDTRVWNDYYNHANEVVHLAPFLFNRAGAPWLTQQWVRHICAQAYGDGPDGIAGDEDVGQMSAWYVLCAAGLHPACPGEPRYELFSPLFDRIVFRLDPRYAKGATFAVRARHNAPDNVYIQSARLNGQPLTRCWITHDELAAGGELELELGPQPNKMWGVATAAEAELQKKYGDKFKLPDYAAYQKLVAALPADEQAWEKILEDQLGGFYFPIHVRERLAKRETAWSFVKDDPALPRILLIGDSISRSYTVDVRHLLAGKANVHRAPANCGPTDSGLKNMDVWLGAGKWDVILFNFGIHDRAKKPELYAANLEKVIALLEKTGAKLVWARTTPFKSKGSKNGDDSPALNKVSDEVMKQHNIPMTDLHGAVIGAVATTRNSTDNTHFNDAGIKLLAAEVVKTIAPLLKKRE